MNKLQWLSLLIICGGLPLIATFAGAPVKTIVGLWISGIGIAAVVIIPVRYMSTR